jgi:hypothetical protein
VLINTSELKSWLEIKKIPRYMLDLLTYSFWDPLLSSSLTDVQ